MKAVTVASISGGKDSVAMCLELERRRWRVDHYVFCDSGVEYPDAYDAIERFEKLTGRKVVVLRPDESFVDLAAHHKRGVLSRRQFGYGWPNMKRRWCTWALKDRPIKLFYKTFSDVEVRELVGIAADETNRIAGKVYPLVKWGMDSASCLRYCMARGFYGGNSVYQACGRLSCFCCPMASDRQINYLLRSRRDLWRMICDMEREIGEEWLSWRGFGFSTRFIERVYEGNGGVFKSGVARNMLKNQTLSAIPPPKVLTDSNPLLLEAKKVTEIY